MSVRRRFQLLVVALLSASAATAGPAVAGTPVALKTTEMGRGPTIVVLHALGGARLDWMPTLRKLIAHHRVVLVDLPGCGDSPLPSPFSMAAAADALDAVLARLNPDSTIVVGHQFGGTVALTELAAHPERARGLVLIDPPIKSPMQMDEQQKKMFMAFFEQSFEQVKPQMFGKLGRDSAQNVAIYATASQVAAPTVKAYYGEMLNTDANRTVKALKVPYRLLVTDRLWKRENSWTGVAKNLGWDDTTLVAPRRIADSGFWLMKDQPDTLAAILSAFAAARISTAK